MVKSLLDVMTERALAPSPSEVIQNKDLSVVPTAPTGLPSIPPKGHEGKTPPAWKRYDTGLKMQEAISKGWTPNPTLVRILNNK